MNILITGATGLVGTSLTQSLLQKGHKIHILSTRINWNHHATGVKVFYWNPKTSIIDENALENIDIIIHLAGEKIAQRWTSKSKKSILNSRIQSSELLYNVLKKKQFPIKHFISASAIGIYPSHPVKIYKEDEVQIASSFPGVVTQQWESKAHLIASLHIPVSIIRIGLVLSEKGGAYIPLSRPVKFGLGAWFGNGKQWQSWIHLDDLVSLFEFVLPQKPACYNGVAPSPVSQKELIRTIAQVMKRPLLLPPIPKFFLKIVLGSMSSVVLDSIRVSSKKLEDDGFVFRFQTLNAAIQDLNKGKIST